MPTSADVERRRQALGDGDARVAVAKRFAPRVMLHERELFHPMAVEEFAAASRLFKVDPQSSSYTHAFNPETGTFTQQPSDSVAVGVPFTQLAVWASVGDWTRRPRQDPGNEAHELLALVHQERRPSGTDPSAGPVPVYAWVRGGRDGSTLISYWFFYGFSETKILGYPSTHQGDWEHVALHIVDERVAGAWFAMHHKLEYKSANAMHFADADRPIVFSALGSHATYWEPWPAEAALSFDDVSDGGAIWDTARAIVDLESAEWRNYAGAWGAVGASSDTTGPLGPWYKRWSAGALEYRE